MQEWKDLIDKAANLCGGQNALARKIGETSGNLSAARSGIRGMGVPKLTKLSEVLQVPVAELWEAQYEARKRVKRERALGAVSAILAMFILSASLPSDAQASTLDKSSSAGNCLYIM